MPEFGGMKCDRWAPISRACRHPYHEHMALSSDQLTEIGERFLASMNARDFASAAALLADGATYQSVALVSGDGVQGCITGRERIMDYFQEALEGDENFHLSRLDVFTGLNLARVLSSMDGRTFIDVLRTGGDGLIVEHAEVSPKASAINFLAARPNQ